METRKPPRDALKSNEIEGREARKSEMLYIGKDQREMRKRGREKVRDEKKKKLVSLSFLVTQYKVRRQKEGSKREIRGCI